MREVVALLAAAGFGSEESFLCLLDDPAFLAAEELPPEGAEGYLFPDTYAFPLATPQERILRTMVRRFREVFTPELRARARRALGLTPQRGRDARVARRGGDRPGRTSGRSSPPSS